MSYPNAYTVAQANSGPYDNSNNPAAQAALKADMAKQAGSGFLLRTLTVSAADAAMLDDLERRGGQIAAANPIVGAVRSGSTDANWLRGFDIATAYCLGTMLPGPKQTEARANAMIIAGNSTPAAHAVGAGFDVSQAMQHGLSKTQSGGIPLSNNPQVAAGQVVVHGVAGSGSSADTKAAVVGTVIATSAAAKAGAAATLPTVAPSIFRRFLNWIEGK